MESGYPLAVNPRPRSRITAAFRDHCLLDVTAIEGATARKSSSSGSIKDLSEDVSDDTEQDVSQAALEDAELLDTARSMERRALHGYSVRDVSTNISLLVQEFNALSLRLSATPSGEPVSAQLGLYLETSRFLQYPWLPPPSSQISGRRQTSPNQLRLRRLRLQQLQQLHRLLQMWHFVQRCKTRSSRPALETPQSDADSHFSGWLHRLSLTSL